MDLLIDITIDLKQANWEDMSSVALQHNPKQGLYLMSFRNKSNFEIHDKNIRSGAESLSGKLIVPRKTTTLKFGKFENYLKNRMVSYYKHMHYTNDPYCIVEKNVFNQCLEKVYLLPLPIELNYQGKIKGAQVFEKFWNLAIEKHLSEKKLLKGSQNYRSEYRNTVEMCSHYDELEKFLRKIASTIMDIRRLIEQRL